MKKFILVFISIFLVFLFSHDVTNAISGACSSHNGVSCSMGRQLDGKVYCNDGWTDSSVNYDFMIVCENYKFSCNVEEWSNLLQKYKMHEVYTAATAEIIQAQKEIKAAEEVTGLSSIRLPRIAQLKDDWSAKIMATEITVHYTENLIKAECEAIGRDRADKANEQFKAIQIEKENVQAQLDKLKQDQLDTKMRYLEDLIKLQNTPRYTCPTNLIFDGTNCRCNDGYVYNGNACVTYTQSCQARLGINSYGDGQNCYCSTGYSFYNGQCISSTNYCKLTYGDHIFAEGKSCVCESGYVWNPSQVACNKIETQLIETINPPKTDTKSIYEQAQADKKEQKQQVAPIIKKQEVKKSITNEATTTLLDKKTGNKNDIPKGQGFFFKTVNSLKGFFSRIFK